jgi:exonuclease VII small subunit
MSIEPSFEEAIARLTRSYADWKKEIVPLSESLTQFTESNGAVRLCTDLLDRAVTNRRQAEKGSGRPVELPFDAEEFPMEFSAEYPVCAL